MKKKILILYAIFVLFFIGVTVHLTTIDGLDGFIWSLMFKDDTRYATGYSDAGFRKIKVGMTEAEVVKILGAPLRVTPADGRFNYGILRYSESPKDTHYRFRIVSLRKGVVIAKEAEFYVD